jgi:hypothetical protein
MEEAGLDFRATKDLDIVLCIEAVDQNFAQAFWQFIKAGRYQNQQRSTGKRLFYRFFDPEDTAYPVMLELFSRIPDALTIRHESHLTPIPVGEDASSLSAILLDSAYYHFVHDGKVVVDGVPVVASTHLIPMKARAYLDVTAQRDAGDPVDRRDMRKHLNDVFRLYQLLAPDTSIPLSGVMLDDFQRFLALPEIRTVDLKGLGLRSASMDDIVRHLRSMYGCSE